MAVPTDLECRACSAHLAQPVNEEGIREAETLVQVLRHNNTNVEFRSVYDEGDILQHVFRWSPLEPQEVFINGFQTPEQGPNDTNYFNIHQYVTGAGAPMEQHQQNYGFVSTTSSSSWCPQTWSFRNTIVYRYEIYAPGGIQVDQTLPDNPHASQQEVIFVRGINRQYIRSAQRFRLVDNGHGHLKPERVDHTLLINPYIDPASHPRRLLKIQRPVDYYFVKDDQGNKKSHPLDIEYIDPQPRFGREKRSATFEENFSADNGTAVWYAKNVCETDSYINAAFSSSQTNEVYLFLGNEYVLVKYAPGSKDDELVYGTSSLVRDGFPSLADTVFAEHGIDCAFSYRESDQAYIFSGNLCAKLTVAPHTHGDSIREGDPVTIAKMFTFLEKTDFAKGVDAAFESCDRDEAYIFKGDQYVLIDYKIPKLVGGPKKITDGFYGLKNTIFETGVEAAFASHKKNEAYLFKGDQYALINFAPGGKKDYIIGGPKKIIPNWPSLAEILPHKNHNFNIPEPIPSTKYADTKPSGHDEH